MSGRNAARRDRPDHDAGGDKEDDARGQETNFEVTRTWDDLEEVDGALAVTGISEAEKRKRYDRSRRFLTQSRAVLTSPADC